MTIPLGGIVGTIIVVVWVIPMLYTFYDAVFLEPQRQATRRELEYARRDRATLRLPSDQ